MSSTSAASATYAGGGGGVLGTLSRIGRSLMLPIAVLPAAALLVRFGQDDMLGKDGLDWTDVAGVNIAAILAKAGGVLFDNLPLLFAVGIAIGFARRSDGSTALAAVVGWLVFNTVFNEMVADNVVQIRPDGTPVLPTMGVLSGILMGIVTALLYQKFYRVKLVPWLAFFGGRRFVPIVTAGSAVILGIFFGAIWPPIGEGINTFGDWLVDQGGVGAGIYGTVNRLLIPFGLHNIINPIMWFIVGEYTPPGGEPVFGDLHRYFAGDPSSGLYMAGFFPVMMFGLPAAALAITHCARPERRKIVGGIMLSAAFCSFLTGVTEPIEFAFIFVAPLLFGIHAVLTGISMWLADLLNIHIGFGFSASFIDFLLNVGKSNTHNPWLVWVVGAVYAVVYYVIFRWAIIRFNIPTMGREPEEEVPADQQAYDERVVVSTGPAPPGEEPPTAPATP
ncbi:MAG TPA: PTS transporter subunit EIIC [Actinomycetes bacterium]|jgi:PTS system N-acetylglucosamine-specific IIC component